MPQTDDDGVPLATARELVERFLELWATQDVPETLALFTEDAVSIVHLTEGNVSASGTKIGREQISEALYGNLAVWYYKVFRPTNVVVDGNVGRVQVAFEYVHLETREIFASTMRIVITTWAGRICRIEFFHDAPRVAAFMTFLDERRQQLKSGS
jgi:ketosteroid isomerase-like protein